MTIFSSSHEEEKDYVLYRIQHSRDIRSHCTRVQDIISSDLIHELESRGYRIIIESPIPGGRYFSTLITWDKNFTHHFTTES